MIAPLRSPGRRPAGQRAGRMAAGQFPAIALAGLLLLPAWHLKHPLMFAWRHAETPLLLGLPLLAWLFRRHLLR